MTTFDAHANLAASLVATAPSPATSGTSLVVTASDGAKFPAAPFNATCWPAGVAPTTTNAEIVRVTNVSTDTFTITRAQESTSAKSVAIGWQIDNTITVKALADVETAVNLRAPLASPALTGTPTAPTAGALTDNTQLATTGYADTAVGVETTRAETAEALLAPKASPALTGNPTAPTQSAGNNSTRVATTAYADGAVATETTRAEAAETLLAPLASPALTGTPTAPTKTALTSNTDIATTAYADSAVSVEATARSTADALKAPIASPTFTGTTTAPEFTASGLTGATAASRYVGATASGAPVSGAFLKGDFVIDQTAVVWICTTAGSPGTWTAPGGAPSGSAGGDLSGTYPNPSVAKIGGIAVSGTPGTGNVLTATSSSAADWAAPTGGVVENVNVVATSSTAQTIPDVTTDTLNDITLTAACTFTFPTAGAGKSFTIILRQNGTGGWTVSWPTVTWLGGGSAPTLSTGPSAVDVVTFVCTDGTHWLGAFTPGYSTGTGQGCTVWHNASQAVGSSGRVTMAWNQSEEDTSSFHSTVTNNSRVTIPTGLAGTYLVVAQLVSDTGSSAAWNMWLRKNGSTDLRQQVTLPSTGSNLTHNLVARVVLAASDYIEIQSEYNSGSGNALSSQTTAFFQVTKVA